MCVTVLLLPYIPDISHQLIQIIIRHHQLRSVIGAYYIHHGCSLKELHGFFQRNLTAYGLSFVTGEAVGVLFMPNVIVLSNHSCALSAHGRLELCIPSIKVCAGSEIALVNIEER